MESKKIPDALEYLKWIIKDYREKCRVVDIPLNLKLRSLDPWQVKGRDKSSKADVQRNCNIWILLEYVCFQSWVSKWWHIIVRLSRRCLWCLDDWDCAEGFGEKGLNVLPVLFSKRMVDTMTEKRKEGIHYGGRRKARGKKKQICEATAISKELLSLCFYRSLSSKWFQEKRSTVAESETNLGWKGSP